jgi:hypothetical protein
MTARSEAAILRANWESFWQSAKGVTEMGSPQAIGALVLGAVVIFIAPALVWAMVIGGLVRIVRERIEETRPADVGPRPVEVEQGTTTQ